MGPRALVSVSDKTGLVELGQALVELGWEIISTGGTAHSLAEAGVAVTKVAAITGFPEILDGRVKTLHPAIHGGILGRRISAHLEEMAAQGIQPIDLVVVNLYPFRQTIARPGVTLEEAIENIDIGGPTMVRAAAKNHQAVTVVVNPGRYSAVIAELRQQGRTSLELRRQLAVEAFAHTAAYDTLVAQYLGGQTIGLPPAFLLAGAKVLDLRYGENPHQQAAFYRQEASRGASVAGARQLQGKELSYNNIVDLEAALEAVREFTTGPACVIIKHTNPCGAALGSTLVEAYTRALAADPVSAFGGVVGLNQPVDELTARELAGLFLEAVIAPDFAAAALAVLREKPNLRLLATGDLVTPAQPGWEVKQLRGGFLVQSCDAAKLDVEELTVVTRRQPTSAELQELLFAWKVVKHVKSNAIILAAGRATLGVGAGQMNRVGSARIALEQAGERARGAVLASDGFFPFPDTVELAAAAGVTAVIQPGGSLKDVESVVAADAAGMTMVMTGIRHFKH